ncbi:MAG TPA: hypothetical protein VHE30_14250 [Polyangiaceae bacterium]|nr:hypothetical protein [Polyangiaceae bacterium]
MIALAFASIAILAPLLWTIVRLFREAVPARHLSVHLKVLPEGLAVGPDDVIEWRDLVEVRVDTTADGPWAPDLFLVLVDAKGRTVSIPSEILPSELIDQVGRLPGFDYGAFIAAQGSTDVATFLCWRRDA